MELFKQIIPTLKIFYETGKLTLEDPRLKQMMVEETFDLLVINFFVQNFFVGIGEHFNCPTIMISPTIALNHLNRLFGNPMEISTVGFPMLFDKVKLSFFDRVLNLIAHTIDQMFHVYSYYKQRSIYE